jgi:Domain of unknown function (DUF4411)
LLAHHDGERLCSIDRIRGELLAGKDALADRVADSAENVLCRYRRPHYNQLVRTNDGLGTIPTQFSAAAKAEFAAEGDGWLVAFARAFGCSVVTLEIANPNIQSKVPIPNLCDAFGIEYTNTFDVLRVLDTQFEWQGD